MLSTSTRWPEIVPELTDNESGLIVIFFKSKILRVFHSESAAVRKTRKNWKLREKFRGRTENFSSDIPTIHCKKGLAIFPSPAGMSLTLPGHGEFDL